MAPSLSAARAAFVTSMKRETSGPELTRLVAVLDDLIKWSVARPKMLSFHETDAPSAVLSFVCAGSKTLCWSARVMRGDAPTLELYPPTGRSLSPETRARLTEMLNTHSRAVVAENGRLRIGFGALKNGAAFEAVTAMLSEVLADADRAVGAAS
jgi:hypothetical protein